MQNFFSPILIICVSLISTAAFGAETAPSPKCGAGSAKSATAIIKVQRIYWVQDHGDYDVKIDDVCTVRAVVPVIEGSIGNCTYENSLTCPIALDGKTYEIVAAAGVHIDRDPAAPTKTFSTWYHIDRNSGSVTTGEASSADITTEDLNMKKIGLSIHSKFDGYRVGQVGRDGIIITTNFEDDAP